MRHDLSHRSAPVPRERPALPMVRPSTPLAATLSSAAEFTGIRARAGGDLRAGARDSPAERDANRFAVATAFLPQPASQALSQARIHTDASSERAAGMLGSAAFTVGNDVYFGRNRFAPGTADGAFLLRHELGHVRQGARTTVRCFESFEHRAFGDRYLVELQDYLATPEGVAWARSLGTDATHLLAAMRTDPGRPGQKIRLRPSVDVTPGDAIALMGDFYGNTDALANARADELRAPPGRAGRAPGILDMIDREERAGRSNAAENVDYENITHHRYSELAMHNAQHFDPANRIEWRRLHEQAMELARTPPTARPGRAPDEDFQRALLIDAAAGHFLTDALAAGHMFDVARVEAAITRYLQANPIRPANPEMQTVTGALELAGLAGKLVLKNIHDHLNTVGFPVTNARGLSWQTYGDNSLARAPQTQRIGALAVFLSRQQIVQAQAGNRPDPGEVLALLPVEPATSEAVTRAAIAYIPDAARGVPALVNAQLGILSTRRPPWWAGGPVGPAIGAAVLGTISDPGRVRQLEDLQRRSEERNAGPLLAPQATVFSF